MTEVALITGANKGIGFEIAKQLGSKGFYLILGCRNTSSGEEALNKLVQDGAKGEVVALDVSSDESIANAFKVVQDKHDHLDVLINNAGIGRSSDPNASVRQSYLDVISVNVAGVAILIDTFAPLLLKSKAPRVVNVSSARGSLTRNDSPNFPPTISVPYVISKAALNLMNIEYSKKYPAIKVNVVSPGHCNTAFNGYRGTKNPADGAKVAVSLACLEITESGGFWEIEGDSQQPTRVEW
jgi:NAD(P)-dependent dehydrogenase (short-subunit alcohol dehydrogenase family)